MTSHLTEDDLAMLSCGEVARAEHLAECAECRAEAEAIARTLSICVTWQSPERPLEFGRDVWARVAPALDATPSRRLIPSWQWWATAAAAAVLLVAAFVLPQAPVSKQALLPQRESGSERVLTSAVADHLDRVQILLTEIANNGDADPERAKDLVADGRLMSQSLAAHGETPTVGLLDEVNAVLTEAAHTPDWNDLRDRIESGSLVFKVRIVESNLRNEEQRL